MSRCQMRLFREIFSRSLPAQAVCDVDLGVLIVRGLLGFGMLLIEACLYSGVISLVSQI